MSQRSNPARYGRATTATGRRRRSSLRSGAGGRLRQHRGLRIALLALAAVSGLGAAAVGVVFAEYQNLKSQLPDAATLAAMEPPLDTNVYARDGTTLIAVLHNSDFRHQHVALKDVSHWLKLATVDVEDKHFYEHSSWDLPRIVKAAWENLRHQANAGGASTITEQLAKISFLSPERSLDRKIKQVILGAEIEGEFSKDQILEMYLNRIPYGNHAIGIETASEGYFNKPAKDLDLAEASMLAGLPNSPTTLNPLNHDPGVDVNPLAKDRQRVVLNAMVNAGDITQQQADDAYNRKLTYHAWWEAEKNDFPAFMDFLRSWLDRHYGDEYIKPGGWDIVTTLDVGKQNLAQGVVKKGVAAIADKNAHDGTLVSMDPRTGQVLAIVGASDPADKTINDRNIALEQWQPGSTIKLFTYTAAIASRLFTMTTTIVDAPFSLPIGGGKYYSPHNYDRSYHGTCSLAQCLGNSFNVPAVKVESKVGIPFITDLEIAAGLKSLADKDNRPWATLWPATLGAIPHGIRPLELADGVSTIADMGVQHDPTPVIRITARANAKVTYADDPTRTGHRVVPEGVAFIMSEITSNDNNRAREFGYHSDLTLPDRRVSAKTGTTEEFASNWTVGWTPDLVTVVAVLNPTQNCLQFAPKGSVERLNRATGMSLDDVRSYPWSPSELADHGIKITPADARCGRLLGSTGITGAAPIWHDYMAKALANTPKHWYTKPPDVLGSTRSDDGAFYLPGTQAQCYYYAAAPDPNNICTYAGTTPPTPAPTPTPMPGAPVPSPPLPVPGEPTPTPPHGRP